MKVFYDADGFIWMAVTDESEASCNGYSMVVVDYVFEGSIIDTSNYIPKYRYIDGQVQQVTDPIVYQVNERIWTLYTLKVRAELQDLLLRKTNQEMHEIYDTSPDYMKDLIGQEINNSWWTKIHQTSINLSLEIFLHVLCEVQGIQLIEGRALTLDEQTAYATMLQTFRSHASFMGFPLKPDAWYIGYVTHMLEKADLVRAQKIQQRVDIMGPLDGGNIYADAEP